MNQQTDVEASSETIRGGAQPEPEATIAVALAPGVTVDVTDDVVLIRQGDHVTRLSGSWLPPFSEALITMLSDGRSTLAVDSDVDDTRKLALAAVLQQLCDAGLVQRDDLASDLREVAPAALGMWLRVLRNLPLRTIDDRLKQGRPSVLGRGALPDRIRLAMADAGLRVTAIEGVEEVPASDDPIRDVVVVVGDSDRDPLLNQWNAEALRTGRTWMPVVPFDGRRALVGPWTLPAESACFTCYRLRRNASFPDRAVIDDLMRARPVYHGGDRAAIWPGLTQMQIGLVVERVTEWLGLTDTNAGLATPGGLHTLEMSPTGLHLESHRVFRVPRCPDCSSARDRGYPMIWFHPDAGVPLHRHDEKPETNANANGNGSRPKTPTGGGS